MCVRDKRGRSKTLMSGELHLEVLGLFRVDSMAARCSSVGWGIVLAMVALVEMSATERKPRPCPCGRAEPAT